MWQVMVLHPDQKSLVPLADVNSTIMPFDVTNLAELNQIFPAEEPPRTSARILKGLEERLSHMEEEKNNLMLTVLHLTDENCQIKKRLVELQKLYDESERKMKNSIDNQMLPSVSSENSNLDWKQYDVPDYVATKSPNINDFRSSHKTLSMTDVVETVVGLQR